MAATFIFVPNESEPHNKGAYIVRGLSVVYQSGQVIEVTRVRYVLPTRELCPP